MKKILTTVLLLMLVAMPSYAKKKLAEEVIVPLTKLEKRIYQTRTYPAQDRQYVLKSALNTLQDEGYMVYNVNSLLGFIYAVKDFDTADKNIDVKEEFGFSQSRMNYNGIKVATFEVNVNITNYGDNIRLRTNFKRKLLNEYGNAQFIDDVEDATFYEDFYAKVDRNLQLQKQDNISKTSDDNPKETQLKSEKNIINIKTNSILKEEIENNTKEVEFENSGVINQDEYSKDTEQQISDEI